MQITITLSKDRYRQDALLEIGKAAITLGFNVYDNNAQGILLLELPSAKVGTLKTMVERIKHIKNASERE